MSRAFKLFLFALLFAFVSFFVSLIYSRGVDRQPSDKDPAIEMSSADGAASRLCPAHKLLFIVEFYRPGDAVSEAQKSGVRELSRGWTDLISVFRVDADAWEKAGNGHVSPHLSIVMIPWDKPIAKVGYLGAFTVDSGISGDRISDVMNRLLREYSSVPNGSYTCEQAIKNGWK